MNYNYCQTYGKSVTITVPKIKILKTPWIFHTIRWGGNAALFVAPMMNWSIYLYDTYIRLARKGGRMHFRFEGKIKEHIYEQVKSLLYKTVSKLKC